MDSLKTRVFNCAEYLEKYMSQAPDQLDNLYNRCALKNKWKLPNTFLWTKFQRSTAFPKKPMLVLSIIHLTMAIVVIITEVINLLDIAKYSSIFPVFGTGIWCGIFFGVSGIAGIIASFKPSSSTAAACVAQSLISVTFSVLLLVLSSFEMVTNINNHEYNSYGYPYYYHDQKILSHAIFATKISVAVIEGVASTISATLAYKPALSFYKVNEIENNKIVHYAHTDENSTNSATSEPIASLQQQQQGCVTITISPIKITGGSAGLVAFPTQLTEDLTAVTIIEAENSPSPKTDTTTAVPDDNLKNLIPIVLKF